MFKSKILFLFILAVSVVMMSGCTIGFKGGGITTDGGVYFSQKRGDTWQQRAAIPTTSGRAQSINLLNCYSLAMDPSDRQALYFGSIDNGLFYTYNYALEWKKAEGLGNTTIRAVEVDPQSKCIIYAAIGNKLYKSTDCNRSWEQVYYDNDVEVTVNTIAIDHYNSKNVYIGTSRGEVIKSTDKGISWQTVGRFDDYVKEVVISPQDSRILFVATTKRGIFRSFNSGGDWESLAEQLKEYKLANNVRDISFAKTEVGLVFIATNYGLLKSVDYGDKWSKIELITPEKEAIINAIAISPKNAKEIYYVTNTTFYRSLDGGENWTTRKLPSSRAGWKLAIDPESTNAIYMCLRKLEKK